MRKNDLLFILKEVLFISSFSAVMGGGIVYFGYDGAKNDLNKVMFKDLINNNIVRAINYYDEFLNKNLDLASDIDNVEKAFKYVDILKDYIVSDNYKAILKSKDYLETVSSVDDSELVAFQNMREKEILDLCLKADSAKKNSDLKEGYYNFLIVYLYNYYQNYLEKNAQRVMVTTAKTFIQSYDLYLNGNFNDLDSMACDDSKLESKFDMLISGKSKEFYDVLVLSSYVSDNTYDSMDNEVVLKYKLLLNKMKICLVRGACYNKEGIIVPDSSKIGVISRVRKIVNIGS